LATCPASPLCGSADPISANERSPIQIPDCGHQPEWSHFGQQVYDRIDSYQNLRKPVSHLAGAFTARGANLSREFQLTPASGFVAP
jgi:hypothetical protein